MGLFIGGKDTKPEIDALMKAIDARPGLQISHAEVSGIIGVNEDSARFQTVTQRWRKIIERERAIRVVSRLKTFHFLTANEAIDLGVHDVHRIGKATGKLCARVEAIDTMALTPERQSTHNLLRRETSAMVEFTRKAAKAIAGPKPVRADHLRLAK